MKRRAQGAQTLILMVLVGVVIVGVALPLFALANQKTLQSSAQSSNTTTAQTQASLFSSIFANEWRTVRDFAAWSGQTNFAQSVSARQSNWPEISGAYLISTHGNIRAGLTLTPNGKVIPAAEPPSGLRASLNTVLGRTLAHVLASRHEGYALSFGRGTGTLGSLYLYEPTFDNHKQLLGAVVLRIDLQQLLGSYLSAGNLLLLAPPYLFSQTTAAQLAAHQLPVLAGTSATLLRDSSVAGNATAFAPTDLSLGVEGLVSSDGSFSYQNSTQIGGSAALSGPIAMSVVIYSAPVSFASAFMQSLEGGIGLMFVLLLGAGLPALILTQRSRLLGSAARADEARSRQLTADILTVSDALSLAREGDLTVEVPSVESEVGLVSVLINGLLDDYSGIVSEIITASKSVQGGVRSIDQSIRSIVESAGEQGEEMSSTAVAISTLATSAAATREATQRATQLAAEASHSVHQGQAAVTRIGDAVDSIKEAAIGTTREFKRLQEDSIRLTALVSSVKNNAENLDMQAANAALEARHLGTETGSAFATNIGRLARQAQETLTDAETAVRSVINSIDAVNRRIEQISEQVRLGVDEVRSVRGSFDGITASNRSLTRFIEQVAATAQDQAGQAQQTAAAITRSAATFEQFNDLLITSSDEMAHMRLIVAALQESVANLRVAPQPLTVGGRLGAEGAAYGRLESAA